MNVTAAQNALIHLLNEQLSAGGYSSAHECAVGNGLDLLHWYDESGGLYESAEGIRVFGWEWPHIGFDDQIDQPL
jgi:hypothetical protein